MWRSVRPDTMLLPIWWSSFSGPRQPLTASLHLRSSPLELMSRLAEQQPAEADSADTVRSKRSSLRCEIQRVGLGFFLSRLQGSERLERQTWTQTLSLKAWRSTLASCLVVPIPRALVNEPPHSVEDKLLNAYATNQLDGWAALGSIVGPNSLLS